jgi:hypothetical protein
MRDQPGDTERPAKLGYAPSRGGPWMPVSCPEQTMAGTGQAKAARTFGALRRLVLSLRPEPGTPGSGVW